MDAACGAHLGWRVTIVNTNGELAFLNLVCRIALTPVLRSPKLALHFILIIFVLMI
jgi:hypothetical protein